MTRREFAMAVTATLQAAALPEVTIIEGDPRAPVPQVFAASAVRFARAYTACPDPEATRSTLLSGRYPHAREQHPWIAALAKLTDRAPVLYVAGSPDGSPAESSVALRMALRHPRLRGGADVDFPVSTVDLAPTLYGLANLEIPREVQGRNLAPLLLNGTGERPESTYGEGHLGTANEWRMVVRGLDKIVFRPNLEILHLFNLGEDPAEEHDLAGAIGYQLRIDELRALARVWMKRTADGLDPSGLKRR